MAALLCAPATVGVTEDGYEVRTELSTTTMRWAMFGRAESTPEFWLLYRDGLFLAFLPRAAFDEAQQAGIDNVLAARAMAA
jgi:YcxB-like protein